MKKVLQASKFPTRGHLDAHVQTLKKSFQYTIEGSKDELARLKLSTTTTVYGAVCVEIGKEKAEKSLFERPYRGPRFESGINLPIEKRNQIKGAEVKKEVGKKISKKVRKVMKPKKK